MKTNGEKQMLWKALAALMTALWIAGGIIHGYAVKDMVKIEEKVEIHTEEIEANRYNAGLLQLTVENIDEKQDKMDATLTEVRDLVLQIKAKME